ncbi:MAG: ABC transporter ATP-binding protein [Phycisphaerales bacterium]|nr:ABC transporter ATP-binding protein [Phycisphaerales bacterium]
MARLCVERVSVHLPVLGSRGHSFKHRLLSSATGGRIGRESGVTVIEALNDVSFDLRDGDRLGVSGHNGAGKTTLLRVLAGAYPPTAGRRIASGRVTSLIDPTLGIEPEATGYENILLRGTIMGLGRTKVRSMREEIAEFSGLGEFMAMPVRTYSSGMLMRLAFAITTSVPADILLMDEWLSVGDAQFRTQAESRMRTLVSGSGILVLASHSPDLIRRECSRSIALERGSVAADAPVVPATRATST